MPICVVVADGSKARLLLAQSVDDPLIDHRDLVRPESRLREQDLVSDGPGSVADGGGAGRHSLGQEKSAHERQAREFAQQICDELDRLHARTVLHRIYLVAAPKLLGHLRALISKQCAERVAGEVDKDLVRHSIDEIRAHLPKRL